MKILYITLENISLHKGSVVHIRETISGLKERGHRIGLIARASVPFDGADDFSNLNPYLFPTPENNWMRRWANRHSMLVSLFFLLFYLFRKVSSYDVIYVRDYHAAVIALFQRVFYKKRIVFEVNGLASEEQRLSANSFLRVVLAKTIKKIEYLASRFSDKMIAVTPQIASYLIHDFQCPSNKIVVVGNGVNMKRFYPITDETLLSNWKEKWGISQEETTITFVGNLAPWQGVDILVKSGFLLLKTNKKVKFLIVGEGLLRNSLVKKAINTGYEKQFIFTGMVPHDDIPLLINISDICVAPFISRRNRTTGVSPLKVFEYMACAKPVVCSKIDGLEFIELEGVGRLVEPEDKVGLQEGLFHLIHHPEKRMAMGEKGLQLARKRFDWKFKIEKIEEVIKAE
jgi:glycosyltransferase involved in cell wall biosynthesis